MDWFLKVLVFLLVLAWVLRGLSRWLDRRQGG